MPDLDKVIQGLYCCVHNGDCHDCCPYHPIDNGKCQKQTMLADALALLKAQEPRVLTLEELQSIGKTWNDNTPPFLWLEIYEVPKGHIPDKIWVPWEVINDTLMYGNKLYNKDNYMKRWRCWNLQPTNEQLEAVKWE